MTRRSAFDIFDLYAVPRLYENRARRLLARFGSVAAVFAASDADLRTVTGMDDEHVASLRAYHRDRTIEALRTRARELGVQVVAHEDPAYPANLGTITCPPPFIFVRGTLQPADQLAIAVVGTRRATSYGRSAARKLAAGLAANGVTVVSGMARGIDTAAHEAALEAGGRTIAVLGCGPDVCYPPENKLLLERIVGQGAVVSEFGLGTPPLAPNFIKRNRLISGLALGVLVVEAPLSSGAMNTVHWASEQGREVYAVPGPLFTETAAGTNHLLREGARIVTAAEDILADLRMEERPVPAAPPVELAAEEAALLSLLSNQPLYVDQVIAETGQPAAHVLAVLLGLEMKGLVQQLPGQQYVRK